jgi:hypothetical protein
MCKPGARNMVTEPCVPQRGAQELMSRKGPSISQRYHIVRQICTMRHSGSPTSSTSRKSTWNHTRHDRRLTHSTESLIF